MGKPKKKKIDLKAAARLALLPVAPKHRNSDVVLTEAPRAQCVRAASVFESAHEQFEYRHGQQYLKPNAERDGKKVRRLAGATPREVHVSQLTHTGRARYLAAEKGEAAGGSAGLTYEMVYDWLHRTRRELDGIPGVGLEGEEASGMTAVERAVLIYGYSNVRDRSRGKL